MDTPSWLALGSRGADATSSLQALRTARFFYWLGMQHARLPSQVERCDRIGFTCWLTNVLDELDRWADRRQYTFAIPVSEDLVRHIPRS